VPDENGVFIRNMIFDATEKHLESAFEKYGEVIQVSIARDARGLSKG
jgi:nucleolin